MQYTYFPHYRTRTVEYRDRARSQGGDDVRLAIHRAEGSTDPASPTASIEAGEFLTERRRGTSAETAPENTIST